MLRNNKDSSRATEEKTAEQSCSSEEFDNDDAQSEGTAMFEGFLDNIGKMLDDEPLDEEAQKRSRKLALRSKLRAYKKKNDQLKSLNVKKLATDSKRKKAKFQS